MRDFKGLIVWQKAHRLTVAVYAVTASFPREERFGLTAQVRKSAASVPTNIAEGCGSTKKSGRCRPTSTPLKNTGTVCCRSNAMLRRWNSTARAASWTDSKKPGPSTL